MNSAAIARTILSLILIPPSPLFARSEENLSQAKAAQMWILASLSGQRREQHSSDSLPASSASSSSTHVQKGGIGESPEPKSPGCESPGLSVDSIRRDPASSGISSSDRRSDPAQCGDQGRSDKLRGLQFGESLESAKSFERSNVKSNGKDFCDFFHDESVKQSRQKIVTNDLQRQSDDIHGQSEIPDNVTKSLPVNDFGLDAVQPNPVRPHGPLESNQRLPLDWLLNPDKGKDLSERVLAYLALAEAKERLPYFQTDIRIAWQIVYHAKKGDAVMCSVAVLSWYSVVGCHPDHFYSKLLAQRKAILGPKYTQLRKIPAKPAKSEKERTA